MNPDRIPITDQEVAEARRDQIVRRRQVAFGALIVGALILLGMLLRSVPPSKSEVEYRLQKKADCIQRTIMFEHMTPHDADIHCSDPNVLYNE